jgi:hypothetical protein
MYHFNIIFNNNFSSPNITHKVPNNFHVFQNKGSTWLPTCCVPLISWYTIENAQNGVKIWTTCAIIQSLNSCNLKSKSPRFKTWILATLAFIIMHNVKVLKMHLITINNLNFDSKHIACQQGTMCQQWLEQ